MNQSLMNSWTSLLDRVRPYLNPPHPGRGKNALWGFILGFLFGVFGVGIALRSLREGLICLLFALPISIGVDLFHLPLADLIVPLFCGFWVVAAIDRDNEGARGATETVPSTDPPAHASAPHTFGSRSSTRDQSESTASPDQHEPLFEGNPPRA